MLPSSRPHRNPHGSRSVPTIRARPALEPLEERLQPSASPAPLGAAAPFALLVTNGGSLTITGNNKVDGAVGVGPHASARIQQAHVHGALFVDPHADRNTPRVNRTADISGGVVAQDLSHAVQDANAASVADAALSSTLVLGRLTDSITVHGNGGTNVIRLTSLNYNRDVLTIDGKASDTFVFNVLGGFDFARSQVVLHGGVTANHVLFNIEGRGPAVHLSDPSSVINGTFLAPSRVVDLNNVGHLNGSIVAHDISITGRGDQLTGTPFTLPVAQLASLAGSVSLLLPNGTFYQPVEGATVSLYNSLGELVATTTTDAAGHYQFTGLAQGTYTIQTSAAASAPGTVNGSAVGVGGEGYDTISEVVLGTGQAGVNYNFVDYFYPS